MDDDWVCLGETPAIDKDEYYFAIEELRRAAPSGVGEDQMIFVHLLVYEHSVSIYKEILRNWKLFRECVTCPLYAVCGVKDTVKWEKFVSRLGFKFLMNIVCENGEARRLFVHKKENKNNEPYVQYEHCRLNDQQLKLKLFRHDQSVGSTAAVSGASV